MTNEELTQIFAESAERTRQHLEELRTESGTEREEFWRRPHGTFIVPAEWLDERLVRLEAAVEAMSRKIDDLRATISER